MNILIDELPQELDGSPICTDFRTWILFEELMLDPEIGPLQKGLQALTLVYKGEPKSTGRDAWAPLLWFYRCGAAPGHSSRGKAGRGGSRPYDFEIDSARIFSAFLSTYKIDLNSIEYLHWWKFRALFDGLPEDTAIMRAIYWRTLDTSKLKGGALKNAKEKQRVYLIRDAAVEEQNDSVAEALMRGEDPGALL